MHNWHKSDCQKPDIVFYGEPTKPACQSCGEIPTDHDRDKGHQAELKIPNGPRRSAMQLIWPSSVSYQKTAYRFDPDGSLHDNLSSQVDRCCWQKEPEKNMSRLSCTGTLARSQASSSQPEQTAYEPLQGTRIRVLRLHKGRFGSNLHASFETIDLPSQDLDIGEPSIIPVDKNGNPAPYEAISYTWANSFGNREKNQVIFISKWWDILPITENCFNALQNCRLEDRDRYLWIDAICINQPDVSERTHQVNMMREIYSAASRVLIYLGVDPTGSGSKGDKDDPEVLSLNPYFSRIWVVQEVGSAKQALILYSRRSMRWDFFYTNLQRLSLTSWMRHFGQARQIENAHSFLTLLEDTRDCSATDPRDKIFALLGLWKAPIGPDYTLSPQAVYTGLASTFVTHEDQEVVGRVLDMASQDHSMPRLPSWVPDWSVKSQQPYQRQCKKDISLPVKPSKRQLSEMYHKFRVHGQTGSLCVLATEIDILAPYLYRGFRAAGNGVVTSTAGQIQISIIHEVQFKCEPNDRVFVLHGYKFSLILRKKADPHIYTFIGLCEYSVLPNARPAEVEAIRYLNDWQWLLANREPRCWSKLANWEETWNCWSTLRKQRKFECRVCFQRLILKAQFSKRLSDLAEDERYVSCTYNGEIKLVSAFFRQRRSRIYQRWRAVDNLLVSLQQTRRLEVRKCLPGHKNLEPSRENLETIRLEQSMWLPISSHWFHWSERIKNDELSASYSLLAACAAKQVPLPPLHLVDKSRRHIRLSIGLDLETGLRQLQRLANDYPLPYLSTDAQKSWSYKLETFCNFNFRSQYWDSFLRWMSKPSLPSFSKLRSESSLGSLLIWEAGFKTRQQIDHIHHWLDTNFDHHLTSLSSSLRGEKALEQFFAFVYREQFELFWFCVFSKNRLKKRAGVQFPASTVGHEFARACFWRFNRSIDVACRVVQKERFTSDQIEQQWAKFLDWLAQQPFNPYAPDACPDRFVSQQDFESDADDEVLGRRFLRILKYYGSLIVPQLDSDNSNYRQQSLSEHADESLSRLVYGEIRRRRLAEQVFSFLLNDTQAVGQRDKSGHVRSEAVATDDQLAERLGEEWRQQEEFWKKVEEYVTESEQHMSCLKPEILGGLLEDGEKGKYEDVYKEIVII